MSKPEDVYSKAVGILEAATGAGKKLDYVKKVFAGWRDNIPISEIPCIIIEPDTLRETVPFYEEESELWFSLLITGIIRIWDKDVQIVGDDTRKGVLDIDRDIKDVFGDDITLSGTAMLFTFPDTRYDYASYPLRAVQISMDIRFRQKYKSRE